MYKSPKVKAAPFKNMNGETMWTLVYAENHTGLYGMQRKAGQRATPNSAWRTKRTAQKHAAEQNGGAA